MKALALTLALFAVSGPPHSHFVDPFDIYMAQVKAGKSESDLQRFSAECGVQVDRSLAKYAIRHENWQPVDNLAKAVYDLESDYFTTGEFWNAGGRHFVIVWAMDIETEIRFTYCFRPDGGIQFADSRLWSISGPGNKGWSFERRWIPNAAGHLKPQIGRFLNLAGTPISKPTLDDDDRRNIEWPGEAEKLNDLHAEADLLR